MSYTEKGAAMLLKLRQRREFVWKNPKEDVYGRKADFFAFAEAI
jgi:hypothetical protein